LGILSATGFWWSEFDMTCYIWKKYSRRSNLAKI